MQSVRLGQYLEIMSGRLALRGQQDVMWENIVQAARVIYAQAWPWSYREGPIRTWAPITETRTFTWVAGDNFLTGSGALALLTYNHTGRRVQVGEVWYTVRSVSRTAGIVALDALIEESNATPTQLTFYRDDFCLHTANLRRVKVRATGEELESWEPRHGSVESSYSFPHPTGDGVRPSRFTCSSNFQIAPPLFPPVVNATSAGAFTAGEYQYGYTFWDPESDQESALGPLLNYTAATNLRPVVTYSNTGDVSESNHTYTLRLYRSGRNPERENTAMYLMQTRTPLVSTPFTDTNTTTVGLTRLDLSSQVNVRLAPFPSEVYVLDVDYARCPVFPPDKNDMWEIGSRGELDELFMLYMSRLRADQDPQKIHAAIMAFNRQFAWARATTPNPPNAAEGRHNTFQRGVGSTSLADTGFFATWRNRRGQ